MATIPGSHFGAFGSGQAMNVVETIQGQVSQFGPGALNLDILIGAKLNSPANPGATLMSPSGLKLDLVRGAFAVTDHGAGNNTLSGQGNETIPGTGGNGTINVSNYETVRGGMGADTISVNGQGDSVTGGSGPDTISVFGSYDTVGGGSGPLTIGVNGQGDSVTGSAGADTISVFGDYDTIAGGAGADTISASGHGDSIFAGTQAGTSTALVSLSGTNMTFVDGPNVYNDTIVGFDSAAGDTINLSSSGHTVSTSSLVNGGQDTQIVLSDGSTILLKGVTHLDPGFFR
jgi:Ca2+-binding RTX toxin-like protein